MKTRIRLTGWLSSGSVFALVGLLAAGFVQAQTAPFSTGALAGWYDLSLVSGANFVSVPLHQTATYRGTLLSSTVNSVTFGRAPGWAADQFGPRDGLPQYILLVTKDASATPGIVGDWWLITGNTSNTLALDTRGENLATHLGAGDELEIRRLTSIKDVFGSGADCILYKDNDFVVAPSQEDVIYTVVATNFADEIFYHDGSLGAEGYYRNGLLVGTGDGSTLTLNPGQPLMVSRKTGSAPVTSSLSGFVQTTRLTRYLTPGANPLGVVFPVDTPLAGSNLKESGWVSDLDFDILTSQEDVIRSVIGTSFADEIFHYAGPDAAQGWYVQGALNSTYAFQPTKGYMFLVRGPGPLIWRQTVPFDLGAGLDAFPSSTSLVRSNGQIHLSWEPYPAAEQYTVMSGTNLSYPLAPDTNGTYSAYNWSRSNAVGTRFFAVNVTPMSSNNLLIANVLNRLAYGPTPDELDRLRVIGPQAYIDEQLAPEAITETGDDYTALTLVTNSASTSAQTNWSQIVVTGLVSSSSLYMYLTAAGEAFIDDLELRLIQNTVATNLVYDTNSVVIGTNYVTNFFLGNNVLTNGDFELPVTTGWTVSANMAGSSNSTDVVHSGASSLRLVATSPGSGQSSSIWQTVSPALPTANNQQCVLSFWYLPTTQSHLIYLRLSGSGTLISGLDAPPPPTWIYATATGTATTTPRLYIYPSGRGEIYLDDLKLVRGRVAEAGTNLLRNGDFELPLTNGWQLTADFTNSYISTNVARSGSASLKLVATSAGGGSGDSVFQDIPAGVTNNGIYTVSFWYIPSTRGQTLTVRLSGSLLTANPDSTLPGLRRRLDTFGAGNPDNPDNTVNTTAGAWLADLKAWFVMNAVGAKRQLLEVLSQFLENHFVTEYSKSFDYISGIYNNDATVAGRIVTEWEYREHRKWRAALLRSDCTFHDLLKISAESPAMIVYLDTLSSRGDGTRVANENYARELYELFCMGVDNGYDQNDIVAQSRAWTGWSVDIVDKANIDNPLAPRSLTSGYYPGVGGGSTTNLVGVWTFNYKTNYHGTNRAPLLSVWHTNSTSTNLIALGPKIVPDRFGPPWAGQPYQLSIPRRTNGQTNSIQDGYDVLAHLANNVPMTAEYISVKLCRLFVHDDFPNPTTRTDLPEYDFYDYRRADLSAEAKLVHDCMLAWWSSSPRGNMRAVLQTIFNSELFRSHGGSLQKVKTPLEYCVSAVRAVRADNGSGGFTASTDGYSIAGTGSGGGSYPLSRMGNMLLFNRDAPDGYPENGSPWISAGTLAERIRFIQTLLMAPGDTARADGINGGSNNSLTDPVALLVRKGVSTTNAVAVADYFLSNLYPAEGAGNLTAYRTLAINFLNTADDGVTPSLFSSSLSATVRDTRVRGMVAMLMTLQRFQEQ